MQERIFPLVFVLTGAANVLLIKWSDKLDGECNDGKRRNFQHPILQTALMFLGQILCFIVYKLVYWILHRREDASEDEHLITRGGREVILSKFLMPAFLDAVACILMFTGLYLTYASSFQMIRGASIIFAGIFGVIYINQTLIMRHWMAMFTIACGILFVVYADVQRISWDHGDEMKVDTNAILTGDLLVLCAQVFAAAYLIYNEKHLKATDIPALQAAGWHGIFGFLITAVVGIGLDFIPAITPFDVSSRGVFDDMADAFHQLRSNLWLCFALSLFVLSSAAYNYVAISIVKFSSTSNLILADSIRVMFIWIMSCLLEWELFNFGLFMAFIILQMGLINYRNAIFMSTYRTLVAIIATRRYASMAAGTEQQGAGNMPASQPADVI